MRKGLAESRRSACWTVLLFPIFNDYLWNPSELHCSTGIQVARRHEAEEPGGDLPAEVQESTSKSRGSMRQKHSVLVPGTPYRSAMIRAT
jgi:hypothetical protein